jgi:hypothetical protein
MQANDKANAHSSNWKARGLVALFILLIVAGAVVGAASALYVSTATSSAVVVNRSVDPAVDAPTHLPFGLEADPAEHELYRQLDAQCRQQIESNTYAPLPDCR